MTSKDKSENQDVSDALNRWEIDNVTEMSVFTIKEKDGRVVEKREVDEYKDNVKTGAKIIIYLFQLENQNAIKEAKFGKQSMAACIKAWGSDASKWRGKKVVSVFAKVGNNPYIIWKPQGALE